MGLIRKKLRKGALTSLSKRESFTLIYQDEDESGTSFRSNSCMIKDHRLKKNIDFKQEFKSEIKY